MGIGESVHSGVSGNESRMPSITLGTVKENWNTAKPGTVKVLIKDEKGEDVLSDWMYVSTPYGSDKCGFFALPEVGSTVVVGYIDDNSVSPVVIGSIWNNEGVGKNNIPSGSANSKNSTKAFYSAKGYLIKVEEDDGKGGIEILTPNKQTVNLDNKEKKITVSADPSGSNIVLDGSAGTVEVTAKTSISLKIGSDEVIKMSSSGVAIKTNSKVSIECQSLVINGSQTKISGSSIEMKSDANLKIESGGMGQIKASMLKLN